MHEIDLRTMSVAVVFFLYIITPGDTQRIEVPVPSVEACLTEMFAASKAIELPAGTALQMGCMLTPEREA